MKNITIALDEKTLSEARQYAQKHHTTLNGLIRSLLNRTVETKQSEPFADFIHFSTDHSGNSNGQKWSREDLYDV